MAKGKMSSIKDQIVTLLKQRHHIHKVALDQEKDPRSKHAVDLIARIREDSKLIELIDSLPEETSYDINKLTPTPSVNIEDVARVQFASHAHVFDHKRKAVFDWEQFKEVAGIFYGFGKRDSLPEETCKDSLQVQETCKENTDSFTDDLEKAASREGFDYVDNIVQESPGHRWNDHDVEFGYRDGFIAGAKWQARQLLKGSPLPEDTVLFQKGVEEGKRLMMEEAVEGTYDTADWGVPCIDLDNPLDKERFDKVKIIIVKQDE